MRDEYLVFGIKQIVAAPRGMHAWWLFDGQLFSSAVLYFGLVRGPEEDGFAAWRPLIYDREFGCLVACGDRNYLGVCSSDDDPQLVFRDRLAAMKAQTRPPQLATR